MQFEVVCLLLFVLVPSSYAAPREGLPLLSPGGIGGIFEGPDSETIIRGPDGSEITSEQKGGAVIRDDGLAKQPIVVAEPELPYADPTLTEERVISGGPIISSTGAPVLDFGAPIIDTAAPIIASPFPLLTGETYAVPTHNTGYAEIPLVTPGDSLYEARPIEIVQQDPHIIETEIVEAPDVEPEQSSDLQGPAGRIITKGSASVVSGPASTTITEPRRIIVAPPKIAIGTPIIATATIPLNQVPLAAPLPALIASSFTPLSAGFYEGSSTLVPPVLSYSTIAVPSEYGQSTAANSLVASVDSTRIDLGANDFRQSIPVVEYSSSNGVLNEPALFDTGAYSSEAPIVSSSTSTVTTDKFAPSEGPAVPSAYLTPPATSQSLDSGPVASALVSSTVSPNVQKIPRVEDTIGVDGRVDMGYPSYEKFTPETYQLPQVLEMALSRFYRKTPTGPKDTVTIDDKMGELSRNEITSYDTRQQFRPPPDLSQAKYIAPALARNGVDASQVNLAPVPLSQVRRLPNGAYPRSIDPAYLANRYERNA